MVRDQKVAGSNPVTSTICTIIFDIIVHFLYISPPIASSYQLIQYPTDNITDNITNNIQRLDYPDSFFSDHTSPYNAK